MKEPFLSAVPVLTQLEDAGYEAYFVGGSVRDYLLNKQISDVDIATSATPEEVKAIFPKTVDIGIEHGTVLVLYGQKSYEITTFRTEGDYQDFRRPKEVAFIRNLKEDLKRRDFTMNAIAMDKTGQVIDPYNGQEAIKNRLIQSVGNAEERFSEDALRMMRAVRFVSQLSFHINEDTMTALKKLTPLLRKIAIERKRAEFEKLLLGENWQEALRIILEANINAYLPGLKNKPLQIERLLTYNCKGFTKEEMWSILIFCLQIDKKNIEVLLREWRLPVKEIKWIHQLIFYLEVRLHQEWSIYDLYKAGCSVIEAVEKLYHVINDLHDSAGIQELLEQYHKLPIKSSKDVAITGSDLMQWFNRSGGPWLKETLMKTEQAILDGKVINDKRKIKEWLLACSQN
ncbi:CCA tRNA nucleotidyltransferase [Neobacillus kokaensis]|uniref:CCA-adding enzyme n=1 Tax=Neobacillus kokaensis TaxID=2759023 RepID=A0ABQ3N0K3_9BACI|nr:CCA tRNA nucleotidyltransferase [Neobacillus kokaensis]GHH98207.1 CCA-adding enzyme [Neobacillus kokaensis]